MSADSERLPPPNEPAAFESLCLDLWKEIWGDSGAQKNGRSGQPQAGVDVFGTHAGRSVGVQCKQKDGLLRSKLAIAELAAEVENALEFRPPLTTFILATSGPRDGKVQERAREITEGHRARGLFEVHVWSWEDIWHELYGRKALLERLLSVYWPRTSGITPPRIAPSKLRHAAQHLFGREDDLARLDQAWADPKTNVLTLVAWGGVGKTALVSEWVGRLAAREYDGASYFDWSFYSQGTREQGGASGDAFLSAALRFFGEEELANSPASAWDKGARLAKVVGERRTLLVLDGLEPLQYPPGPLAGELKDPGVPALLKGLAARNAGLCVVTTREGVKDLVAFQKTTAPKWPLQHLSMPAGVDLLKSLGVWGSEKDLAQLVEDVRGHALTLNLLGHYLAKAHGGDVRRRDRVSFTKADLKTQGSHAFKTMAAYERWLAEGGEEGERQLAVLRLLGLFDRPADAGCLSALRRDPAIPGLTEPLVGLEEEDWNDTVANLAEAGLIMATPLSLDAHPLLRQYFAERLRKANEAAWRAAHGRVYEHLRDSTEHWPDTLEGLQPLYQAVAHGCWAGRHQSACFEVYRDRILRGTGYSSGFYSTWQLGAYGADLGAVACFFDSPWSRVSPSLSEGYQAWLLTEAATRMIGLGRLPEALEPMRAGLPLEVERDDWMNAAIRAGNLSELELTLGDLPAALRDAEQAVALADRSADPFQRMARLINVAEALRQAGRREEALERFREAERMQAERQPKYPLLYSPQGFPFCDLLLGDAERTAWRVVLGTGREQSRGAELCLEVEGRGRKMFEWRLPADSLLEIALDHLTLARAKLYRAILEGTGLAATATELAQAVDGLRRAGDITRLPPALLTRALLHHLQANPEAARADLAEAQELAERGPMPLFLADVHLHRARLIRDREALAAARALIEKHGYGRRLLELADAEEAAEGW
ncbi:MAG TPA: hypothetical protein VF017_16995 [Thermoanaerobaculia bacterium]|nr:hypothetical protein [Thermoanaerobaculia bacterium]